MQSPAFTKPFPLLRGGIVKARVVNTKDKAMSDVAGVSFGMAKTKWKIASVSYTTLGGGEAERAIDEKPETFWHIRICLGNPPVGFGKTVQHRCGERLELEVGAA